MAITAIKLIGFVFEIDQRYTGRLQAVIAEQEQADVARLMLDYAEFEQRLTELQTKLDEVNALLAATTLKPERAKCEKARAQLAKALEKQHKKLAERDEKIAEAHKRAQEECAAIAATGDELRGLYADPAELARHARVVDMREIEENEFNLNIPRYVDTFEPEPPIDVNAALRELDEAEREQRTAEQALRAMLQEIGYRA